MIRLHDRFCDSAINIEQIPKTDCSFPLSISNRLLLLHSSRYPVFLNFFFIVLLIRSGWQVRTTTRPPAHWTRNNKGLIRTKGSPTKISLHLWLHLSLAAFWVLNGIIIVILLFPTGQWMRTVPLKWDVFPHAISVAIQYASLNWPTENGWVNYNSLQLLAYFVTVFIAAPLAFITGGADVRGLAEERHNAEPDLSDRNRPGHPLSGDALLRAYERSRATLGSSPYQRSLAANQAR